MAGFREHILQSLGYSTDIVAIEKMTKPELVIGHGYSSALPSYPHDYSTKYQSVFAAVTAVYRCVTVISQTIANLKLITTNKISGAVIDIDDDPNLKVLRRPNKWQTYFDFWEQHFGYLELQGEVPWLLDTKRDGQIKSIFPLRPDRIQIIPSAENYIDGYIFDVNGEQVPLLAKEIQFWKYFNPNNEWRGTSPISAAANDIELELQSVKANQNIYKKGARPSGILTTDKPVQLPQLQQLSDEFNSKYTGSDKFGKVVFLSHGFKWDQMSMSNKDMQTLEQRIYSGDQIGEVYGVPPILRMRMKDSSVISNADVQMRVFWENTILPKLTKTEQIMNEFIIPRITRRPVKVAFDKSKSEALKRDVLKLANAIQKVFECGGATPNMILEKVFGDAPIDNPAMNTFYINPNLVPLMIVNNKKSIINESAVKLQSVIDALPKFPVTSALESISNLIKESDHNSFRIKVASSRARFNAIADKKIAKYSKVIAKLFKEQGVEVLNNLSTQKIYKSINVNAVQFDYKKWVAKFKEANGPAITSAVVDASEDLIAELDTDKPVNISNPRIQAYIGSRSDQYAKQINDTSKEKIDNIIRKGISDGLSVDDIAEKLETYFVSSQTFRAQLVARTEMVTSMNFSRAETMKQVGYKKHRWITMRDAEVRDSHSSADGQEVEIDSEFTQLGGDYGGDRNYPSDMNERCYTIPVS